MSRPPPNFHQFYAQQMKIDPEFRKRYDMGWEKVMEAYAKQQSMNIHRPLVSTEITSNKAAADRMIQQLSRSVAQYRDYIVTTSPITHGLGVSSDQGETSIARANTLLEKVRNETSLAGVICLIQDHVKKYPSTDSHALINFFMNELKHDKLLVDYLNAHNESDTQLSLDAHQDYTHEKVSPNREEAIKFLSSMSILRNFKDRYQGQKRDHQQGVKPEDGDSHKSSLESPR